MRICRICCPACFGVATQIIRSLKSTPTSFWCIGRPGTDRLASEHPARGVALAIGPGIGVQGDGGLLQRMLESLLANWKYTAKGDHAQVQIDSEPASGSVFALIFPEAT